MLKRLLILIFTTLCPTLTTAQYTILGADAYGQGQSLVAVPSFASLYQNPAGIGYLNHSFVAASYFRILPVEGLHTIGIGGVLTANWLNMGFTADSFGDEYFRETRFGLLASKKLDKVSIGAKMSYLTTHIGEMNSHSTVVGDIGMLIKPSSFFSIGLNVNNFTRAHWYGDIILPTIVSVGIGLNPSNKVTISSQLDYNLKNKPDLKVGLHYQIKDPVALSVGVIPALKGVHFGISILPKNYGFIYAVATHPNVGLAQHLTLIYRWNE